MTTRAKTTRARTGRAESAAAGDCVSLHDFEQLAGVEGIQLEHLTIPGFLRRIPHKWHIDEITRFGDKVGRAAEAMQLSYITSIDRCLGVIRVFPRPLLERIYAIMAPQLGWPAVVEAMVLEDGKRTKLETLKKLERTEQGLAELRERSDNVDVLSAVQSVCEFIRSDAAKLREEIEAPATASGS